jgi:hypothetical protein
MVWSWLHPLSVWECSAKKTDPLNKKISKHVCNGDNYPQSLVTHLLIPFHTKKSTGHCSRTVGPFLLRVHTRRRCPDRDHRQTCPVATSLGAALLATTAPTDRAAMGLSACLAAPRHHGLSTLPTTSHPYPPLQAVVEALLALPPFPWLVSPPPMRSPASLQHRGWGWGGCGAAKVGPLRHCNLARSRHPSAASRRIWAGEVALLPRWALRRPRFSRAGRGGAQDRVGNEG